MTIYNIWIFDESGTLLFYKEWLRKKHTSMDKQEEAKLLYGMLFSIKSFANKLSPDDMKEGFQSFKTNKYRLNVFETPTQIKFVMNTDTAVTHPIVRDLLQNLYRQIYVEYALKNPLYKVGTPIESDIFAMKLDEFVRSASFFSKVQ